MIELVNGISYSPEAKAIIAMTPSRDLFDERDMTPVKVDTYTIAPWGAENDLPDKIIAKAEKSDVVSSNLHFATSVAYGLGPKPMRRVVEDGKIVGAEEIIDGEIAAFFEDNDVGLYLLSQLNDVNCFYNAFPEIILSADSKKIVSLRSKEAKFSRWGVMNNKGVIDYHYYSAKWADSPKKQDIIQTFVLDEYNPYLELTELIAAKKVKEPRFIMPVFMPTPGRPYYPKAAWWSIFESGWYDLSVMLAPLKISILKNKLGVQYIIYISEKYFEDIFKKEGIDPSDKVATKARIEKEKAAFADFLSGEKNAAKSIMAFKKMVASGSSVIEEKYIEIVPIKNDMSGGELIEDSEEASNMLCYAMGVHPNLVGATPGKSKGSLGGTDKRELFLMKQALMKPYTDRVLRVFNLIKRFNGWDNNFYVSVPEYIFTSLDKNKSGKEIKE